MRLFVFSADGRFGQLINADEVWTHPEVNGAWAQIKISIFQEVTA